MSYWWEADPNERYWVEIRRVQGIGTSLECPDRQINKDGSRARNPWYELVHSVRKGETVYHYNEREQRFVGRSVAASDAQHVADTYTVKLEGFTPIAASIDLAYMRARSASLFRLREELKAAQSDATIYTPFQFRGSFLYGMMSNYFAKLPRDVVAELFGVDGLAEEALPEADDGTSVPASRFVTSIPAQRRPATFIRSSLRPTATTSATLWAGDSHGRGATSGLSTTAPRGWRRRGWSPCETQRSILALRIPPVIIEGKTVPAGWAQPVRQAVSQLYEYRYFKVASPHSTLVFLAEKAVPESWVRYLKKDRKIGVMWPSSGGYHLSRLARSALRL